MIDSVGNEIQDGGAVIPKACQKCKIEFKSDIVETDMKQTVPFYKCQDCNFSNTGGDATLTHKIETNHIIKKINKDRIVGVKRQLSGSLANIKKYKNDIIVLCDDCI